MKPPRVEHWKRLKQILAINKHARLTSCATQSLKSDGIQMRWYSNEICAHNVTAQTTGTVCTVCMYIVYTMKHKQKSYASHYHSLPKFFLSRFLCWLLSCFFSNINRFLSPLKSLKHCLQSLRGDQTVCTHSIHVPGKGHGAWAVEWPRPKKGNCKCTQ